jgi:hypothetical protein
MNHDMFQIDEEPWEPYATVDLPSFGEQIVTKWPLNGDRSGAVIVWLLGAIVAALIVGWLVVR